MASPSHPPLVCNTNIDQANPWFSQSKVEKMKSVLVVKKQDGQKENLDKLEQTVVDNNIPLTNSFVNKNGDKVLVCPSVEVRDNLKAHVQTVCPGVSLESPGVRLPTIAIVGLSRDYSSEELANIVHTQNEYIQNFVDITVPNDHFKVFAIKPLRNNPEVYQAVVNVSNSMRKLIANKNNKIMIGLNSCIVYDRFHVKRCNRCQQFGHYVAKCNSGNRICALCAQSHETKDCPINTSANSDPSFVCINCKKANNNQQSTHAANSLTCPCYIAEQEKLKKHMDANLN